MDIVIKITQFILSFSLLVLIHEFGHFFFARQCGIRVDKFYLFFNPWFSLFKFNWKGTEFGMGWVPFGGYCKIAGMIDESMDTESMAQPPKPDEFRSKPAWQRLLVMVGGVMMNVVLAVCIYIGISFAWGRNYIPNAELTQGSMFNSLAHEVGFQDGDRVVSVDGVVFEDYDDVFKSILMDMPEQVEVLRNGQPVTVRIDDKYRARMLNEGKDFMSPRMAFVAGKVIKGDGADAAGLKDGDRLVAFNGEPMVWFDEYLKAFGANPRTSVTLTVERTVDGATTRMELPVSVSSEGKIGVAPAYVDIPLRSHQYTFLQAIPAGVQLTGKKIGEYWKQLSMIFQPKTEAYKSLGGVIAIGSIFPNQWSWADFWTITAFFSIVLAVMNLIPLPALDGGHVVFLLYEVVSGHKPSDKFLEYVQTVGFFILMALLLYANGNDIYRVFIK